MLRENETVFMKGQLTGEACNVIDMESVDVIVSPLSIDYFVLVRNPPRTKSLWTMAGLKPCPVFHTEIKKPKDCYFEKGVDSVLFEQLKKFREDDSCWEVMNEVCSVRVSSKAMCDEILTPRLLSFLEKHSHSDVAHLARKLYCNFLAWQMNQKQ